MAVDVDDVNGARWSAFGFRIESHARPHAGIKHDFHRVFFDMIDDNAAGGDSPVTFEGIED